MQDYLGFEIKNKNHWILDRWRGLGLAHEFGLAWFYGISIIVGY